MSHGGTALVTGSVTGIGRSIAEALMADGWRVVIHGPDEAPAARVAGELGAFAGIGGDLADPATPVRLVEEVVALGAGLHGLVNNAATTTRADIATADAAGFDRIMAVNARAPMLLIQAALPHLRAAGGGRVVNVGSVNAHCGQRDLLLYSMSKGALTTLTRNLSDVLGPDRITVNQVNPGWTLTENEYELKVREGLPADWPSRLPVWTAPSGRLIAAEEIASIVALFMSDRIGPISGTVLDAQQFPMIGRNPTKVTA
jgi:NAD(P)-dependent dehydrogenase (short-subunit alcohol dehydrogenase family)